MKPSLVLAITSLMMGIALFPQNSISAPQNEDAEVIYQLVKAGSDLKKPHKIGFVFYFMTEENANNVAIKLKSEGLDTYVGKAPSDSWFAFRLQADLTMLPIESDLSTLREKFNSIAASEGAVYAGWGADVVK